MERRCKPAQWLLTNDDDILRLCWGQRPCYGHYPKEKTMREFEKYIKVESYVGMLPRLREETFTLYLVNRKLYLGVITTTSTRNPEFTAKSALKKAKVPTFNELFKHSNQFYPLTFCD
uniref:Uncharacterized protein n=1 Tax=Cacopsylla melanoneura TaxID=428564 RepID=A0A8D8XL71_9HEMI